MSDDYRLKWQKDFDGLFDVYSTFILEGLVDDLQPYREYEGAPLTFLPLYEYLSKVYSESNEDRNKRKVVIVYDPSEAESLRFHIYGDTGVEVPPEEEPPAPPQGQEAGNAEPKINLDYKLQYGKKLSQRFYDICHNEEVNKLLIDHGSDGPSLDIAKIHYAVTYESARSDSFAETVKGVLTSIFDAFQGMTDEESGYLFVIKMSSRLLTRDGESGGLSPEELTIFRQLLTLAQVLENDEKVGGKHKLVVLANSTKDLPSWFVSETENPFIKILTVSKPSEENRIEFFRETILASATGEHPCVTPEFVTRFQQMEAEAEEAGRANPFFTKFNGYTNDFSTKQLLHYRDYLVLNPLDDPAKIGFSVSTFVVGDIDNPWDDDEKIRKLINIKEAVSRKIKGQEFALEQAESILRRAALGLDRDENPNAPRAILFLAGPTGTGKTEICKQIAEIVFGSEDRIVRFDMSEYGEAESDQKLFGAPPGYVGYAEGGKLTNAVKKEPFSLVLFDEIEKAHNSILDKFLQILGDGRLTDGHGETVRFTDTIIVITSNAGVTSITNTNLTPQEIREKMDGEEAPKEPVTIKEVIEAEEALLAEKGTIDEEDERAIYERLKAYLRYNVKAYFYVRLGRPELYGRIEDSIVYYNFIGRNYVLPIVKSKIKSVVRTAENNYGVHIEIPDSVYDAITEYCQRKEVRAIGARGIIKTTGKLFSTSLAVPVGRYVNESGGKTALRGRTLTASCEGEVRSAADIHWSVSDAPDSEGNN